MQLTRKDAALLILLIIGLLVYQTPRWYEAVDLAPSLYSLQIEQSKPGDMKASASRRVSSTSERIVEKGHSAEGDIPDERTGRTTQSFGDRFGQVDQIEQDELVRMIQNLQAHLGAQPESSPDRVQVSSEKSAAYLRLAFLQDLAGRKFHDSLDGRGLRREAFWNLRQAVAEDPQNFGAAWSYGFALYALSKLDLVSRSLASNTLHANLDDEMNFSVSSLLAFEGHPCAGELAKTLRTPASVLSESCVLGPK